MDFYGTELYGFLPYVEFDANPFVVEPLGYDQLRLFWVQPTGEWSSLKIVRNAYGAPDFDTDGEVLAEYPHGGGVSEMVDSGLKGGNFYYYAVFVFDTVNEVWRRAAASLGLAVANHDHSEQMFRWLPGWYQESDREIAEARHAKPPYGPGPLKRFLDVIGLGADRLRTEYESLRDLNDPERVSGNLIPALAQKFHVPFEPSIGMRRTRFWTRDAVFLCRRKGTLPGIAGYVSTITGWDSLVGYGPNRLKGIEARAWWAASDTTISDDLDASDIPRGDVVTEVSSTGATWRISNVPDAFATHDALRFYAVPVDADIFALEAEFRTVTGSGEVTLEVSWYDADEELMGTTTGTAESVGDEEWTKLDLTPGFTIEGGKVPAYARVSFTGTVPTRMRRASLSRGAGDATWNPPRMLEIALLPVRTNFVTNPSFEVGTASWAITDGAGGIERATGVSVAGEASLQVDPDQPTEPVVVTGGPYAVEPDEFRFTASAWVRGAQVRLQIEWVDGALATLGTTPLGAAVGAEGEWDRATVSGFPPADAAFARVHVEVTGERGYLDAVMLEEADTAGDYFDGSFFGADYIWDGNAHSSASRYYPARTIRHARLRELLPRYLPVGQTFFNLNYVSGDSFQAVAGSSTVGIGTLGSMHIGGESS